MAERKVAERNSDDSPKPERAGDSGSRSQSGLGRRIATVLVASGLTYLVTVGIVSVVPQVFWPEGDAIDPSITCAGGLRDLRDKLLAFAGEHVARGGSTDDTVEAFLAPWDRRYRGLEERCVGDEHDAWVLVGRLRERLQGTLARFDAQEGALARDMDRALARGAP